MRIFSRLRDQRYCAFCKARRRVYVKKHVDLTNVLGAVGLAMALSFTVWGAEDPRGFALLGLFLVASEIFVYLRWRLSLICRMCGFDPVIYKRSPERAALLVNQFFKEQLDNPEFLLTRSPLLNHQKKIRNYEKKAIERQIITNRAKASSLASNKSL